MSGGFGIQHSFGNNSNQPSVFNLSTNPTSQHQPTFGSTNSQFNSSMNQVSSNSMFGNSSATPLSNPGSINQSTGLGTSNNFGSIVNKPNTSNAFTFPSNTSTLNNSNNSVLGNKSVGFPFGGTTSQNNFNIGNQNTLNQTSFSFGNTNPMSTNTLGNTSATQSIFGSSNPVVSQQSFGAGSIFGASSNMSTSSTFGNPSTSNSNVFVSSQTGNNFPNMGTNNMASPMLNLQNSSSASTSLNISTPQSNPTFRAGTSNFSLGNTQQNLTSIASNVPSNSFNLQSSTVGQSTVNVTQAANSNTFSFGAPKANNIFGSNNFTSTLSNFSAPLTTSTATFSLSTTVTPLITTTSNKTISSTPFLNLNASTPSTISQIGFGSSNTGLGGISSNKIQVNNASPLASSSVSAKKGLGGSPISDSSKSVTSKDAAQKISVVKQVKDIDLLPELKETVESFKKFVTEQKKLREEIIKSNEVVNLITRVEEDSQILRQSISDVANGLQKIQVQSNKLKSDICKEQSNIKIAQTSSESSLTMTLDRHESSSYFSNKVRELENRAGLYLQEIEVVESICNSSNKSALTTRDLVEIIRKMDDEFIGLAAKLYMIHERVKTAKTEYSRRIKQANNHQNPFLAIEGRFGDTFESINGLNNSTYKKSNILPNSVLKISDTVGGSPFDNSCYINQTSSFSIPKASNNIQKPSIFGLNNNNNQITISSTTPTTSPFSFSTANSSFSLNKPPTSLFLNDTVSNKKRR